VAGTLSENPGYPPPDFQREKNVLGEEALICSGGEGGMRKGESIFCEFKRREKKEIQKGEGQRFSRKELGLIPLKGYKVAWGRSSVS